MKFLTPREFTGSKAWDALPVTSFDGVTARLHWTDAPYRWHVNDGDELFVVLDGTVDMHVRDAAGEQVRRMHVGDIFHASAGTEHVAHPSGEARILVIEREGSA